MQTAEYCSTGDRRGQDSWPIVDIYREFSHNAVISTVKARIFYIYFSVTHNMWRTMKKYRGGKILKKRQAGFLAMLTIKFLLLSSMVVIWSLDAKAVGVHGSNIYIARDNLLIATQDQIGLSEDKKETPMPITLTSFEVSQDTYEGMDAAHIKWAMSSEIGTMGFYILRSTNDYYDDAVAISEFIPCLGGIHSEYVSEYEYWDTRIISSRITYVYWLQEVKNSGRTIYGPLYIGGESRTVDDSPAGTNQPNIKIHLPILMN